MENMILLFAAILCGSSALLSILGHSKCLKKLTAILWCLSVLLIMLATTRMVSYLILSRFEYLYIYNHSSSDTSFMYKLSALWSGQEGSFLLWALLLGLMGFFVINNNGKWASKSFCIYSTISFCIFLMCFITKPFAKMESIPIDGLGLNSALKNPWMVVHPPMVFIAYSCLAILFSLLPALKYYDSYVAKLMNRWLQISWCFLGIGILSGSIWAYRALGWGGYWAWDPIENAALVPWLILCGYIHKKNYNNKSVCVIPFTTACFGVFLARSGILKHQSVHAYTDGNWIITGIISVFLISVILFLIVTKFRKYKRLKDKNYFVNFKNELFICCIYLYAALIFLGTVTPIIFQFETPIAFYNIISIVFALLYSFMLLLFDLDWLKKRNILMMALSTGLIIGFIVLYGSVKIGWLLLLWICLMPLSLWIVSGFCSKSKNYYFSHLGFVLLIVGTISSSALGKDSIVLSTVSNDIITIEGKNLSLEEISNNDMLIQTFLTQDILINSADISISQDKLLIPYTTKPLIILFWVGGFMIIAQPCILAILCRIMNSKSRLPI